MKRNTGKEKAKENKGYPYKAGRFKKKTMNDLYGDGTDHLVCRKCGMCKTCKDCQCKEIENAPV